MADVDPHTLATFAFAQLQRDPSFRRRYPIRNVYVCIESDLLEDVRRQARHHFPDGGEIACYYPRDQRIMFVRHGGHGQLPGGDGETLKAHDKRGEMTIGMIVDMIYRNQDWMDQRIGGVSTSEVEKLLPTP